MADSNHPHTVPHRIRLPVVRLEHVWIVLAFSGVGILISLAQTVPNDFWWHLKIGQVIATSGIPNSNIFSWALPTDEPFVYQSWLGEWLFFAIYQVGGLPLVIFARNMLGLIGFGLVAIEAHRRSDSWPLASGAMVLAVMMSLNNLTARTQNWSWVPFGLLLLLLGSYSSGRLAARWLIALPLMMIFWVNAHGGFMIGLLATGAFVVGETLRRLLQQPHALPWQKLKPLYLAAVAMGAVTVINPLGVGVFTYVLTLLTDPPSQQLVTEWQPADPGSFTGRIFYGGVLLLIAAFAFARRRPSITDVLLVCGFGWMALSGVRYVMWFAMVAMPIVAQSLAAPRIVVASSTRQQHATASRTSGGSPTINLVLVSLLLLLLLLVQPWFKATLPLPDTYVESSAPVPDAPLLFTATTPVQATEYLRAEPCQGRLFNEMGYGSYLIWALYPQTQVFVDPRVELYPLEVWEDYIAISQGRNLDELLDHYAIACVLLDTENQPGLVQELAAQPNWQRTYSDKQSEVWRRVAPGE